MKISVIIPTNNRAQLLPRALESVIQQTYKPFEIVVVDDGSVDSTKNTIDNFQSTISLKYIYQKKGGVSNARNNGIKNSNGDWVAFLDSDDEWMLNKLAKQVLFLENHHELSFCHTDEIWVRNGVRINQMKKHKKFGGKIFEKCLDICRISPSSVLIKKTVFNKVGFFDEELRVCEDYDLWLKVTAKFPVLFLDEPLIIKYGGHNDQLSKVSDGIERYRIKSLEKIISFSGLTSIQKRKAIKMLIRKLKIYGGGLKKRKRIDNYNENKKKIHYWINMLKLC